MLKIDEGALLAKLSYGLFLIRFKYADLKFLVLQSSQFTVALDPPTHHLLRWGLSVALDGQKLTL